MTTQPPVEEQKAAEADDEELKGWPHQAIQDIDDQEREALLAAGGPVGEAARVAWAQYQTSQRRADAPFAGNDASGPNSGVGMQEMPVPPAPGVIPKPGTPSSGTGGGDALPIQGSTTSTPTDEIDTPEEEAAETGTLTERQEAEAKAAERNLEIRDYGTEGEWRVYDPATGRQVAKSRLDAPV